MVRTVADRALLPTRGALEEIGDMMILTGKTVVSAIEPPYPLRRRARLPVPVRVDALPTADPGARKVREQRGAHGLAVDPVFTQTLLATHPEINLIR